MIKDEIPVENKKRLYYQYLGFINTFEIFNKNILNIENFYIDKKNISYENFKKFELKEHLPLGKRVELFFEFYINNSKNYKILKKNIQIIKDKVTLGELDFIIKNLQTKKIIHIELIYKYYIIKNNEQNEIKKYIGVNNHDTLFHKTNKLKNKQFIMLKHEQTKLLLHDLPIYEIKQKVCFLANIFLPINNKNQNFDIINQKCISGNFINKTDFIKDEKYKYYSYFIPQKQDWLIHPKYCNIWHSYIHINKQLEEYFILYINPLVWIKKDNTISKLFILNV